MTATATSSKTSMTTTQSPIVVGLFRDHTLAEQAIDELRHTGFRADEIKLVGHKSAPDNFPDELVSKGVPADDAEYYQQQLEAGRMAVVVESYGHQQQARDILYRYGASDASLLPAEMEGDRVIPVCEEQLQVHKLVVPIGEVVIRKKVITEEKTITVPVTREELVIEQRSGSEQPTDQAVQADGPIDEPFEEVLKDGGTLRIILREEQVRVDKYPVVKEEILLTKQQIQETRQVTDTLKREEAHIEHVGNVNIHGIQGTDGEDVSS